MDDGSPKIYKSRPPKVIINDHLSFINHNIIPLVAMVHTPVKMLVKSPSDN